MGKRTLEMIAKELRDWAKAAYGDPPTVRIRALTLQEYANAIEEETLRERATEFSDD